MIGILDWGIGGLGFFAALRARHPRVPVCYWSDAGETPYGKLPAAQLAARVREVAARLAERGVGRLVIACNAASTVLPALGVADPAGPLATRAGTLEVTGVITHAVRLAVRSGARTLGIIGGRRTIRSGIYGRALRAPRRRVLQRVAQPLSARVEAGDLASAALDRELTAILAPLRGVEALLLACTHYPALGPRIALHLPRAHQLDPVDELLGWVGRNWLAGVRPGHDSFVTTGDPAAMRRAAKAAFGLALPRVRRVAR
jgi:glutamate racemase